MATAVPEVPDPPELRGAQAGANPACQRLTRPSAGGRRLRSLRLQNAQSQARGEAARLGLLVLHSTHPLLQYEPSTKKDNSHPDHSGYLHLPLNGAKEAEMVYQ